MPEAIQRMPVEVAKPKPQPKPIPEVAMRREAVKTENLEALAFKVPPHFRRRFRQFAVAADLKQNELLFAALDAWEETHGLKK